MGGIFLSTLSLRRATHYDNYNLHCVEISIHALLAESDVTSYLLSVVTRKFLSTLSLRRATSKPRRLKSRRMVFLSTLSLRRATLFFQNQLFIHNLFLSTLSLRRATETSPYRVWETQISIHALLAESDPNRCTTVPNFRYFYPRSPCGERLGLSYFYIIKITDFYPRSPCGERPSHVRGYSQF